MMNGEEKEKLIKKLSYISKSKYYAYNGCPLAFKFSYLDKVERLENPVLTTGNDVHTFIENFFNTVEIDENGNIIGISKMVFHPNMQYKKSFARFELERWQTIANLGFGKDFFFPVFNEKQWTTENPKLIGIVDRVHKCCSSDPYAPKHPDFKDGDLVIVENKTGKPTADKCTGYEDEMLWYKIIIEVMHPELAPIKWGAIYFPYDNYIYHVKLENDRCRTLAKDINLTRKRILNSIQEDDWQPNPSKKQCAWCNYKHVCEHKVE